jgi:hypothetical protein
MSAVPLYIFSFLRKIGVVNTSHANNTHYSPIRVTDKQFVVTVPIEISEADARRICFDPSHWIVPGVKPRALLHGSHREA